MKVKYYLLVAVLSCFFSPKVLSVIDPIAEQYVRLVLAMGEHDPAYVDAYYGPELWRQQAKQNQMPLAKIINSARILQRLLEKEQLTKDEMRMLRINYLKTQLGALESRAMMLQEEVTLDFDQQSKALFDTVAPQYSFAEFDATLNELNQLLPGKEPLVDRVESFKRQFIIPENKLKLVFDAAIKACRERTKQFVALLKIENFSLEFVKDKPWSGYNWYKGNGYSLIQVNTELPIYISRAIDLGCHEGYPGHHTYNSLLESNLYMKRGWVEYSIYPLFSPQSLIAEGSANYGIELAFPGDEKIQFEKKVLYPLAGLDPDLAEHYSQLEKLLQKLNFAGNEVARLYINKKIDAQRAQQMLSQYVLMSDKKAAQRVKFIDSYGAYVINYNWGKEMVKRWVESGEDQSLATRWTKFTKLLSSPMLPSNLN